MTLQGTTIGEYQVLAQIGRGGMGEVYEGLQPLIGKRVAIKVLAAHAAANAQISQRFLAEARAVNAIGHRGIVDIFSFGTLPDGREYFVMELLPGEPLNKYLKRSGPLPVLEVLELLDDLLDALGAAHDAGIVHRDLKPSNLFLVTQPNRTRYLKLLDFGIAKAVAREGITAPNIVLGTPTYMAPEQVAGVATPASDLYAVGCIAWALLAGRPPFSGAGAMEILEQHQRSPVPALRPLRADVPELLEQLVTRLMAKAPRDRPLNAHAVRAEVRRLREGIVAAAPDRSRTAVDMRPLGSELATPAALEPGETTALSDVSLAPAAKTAPAPALVVPAATTDSLPAFTLPQAAPTVRQPRPASRSRTWGFAAAGLALACAAIAWVATRPEPAPPPAPALAPPPDLVAAPPAEPPPSAAPTREALEARVARMRSLSPNRAATALLEGYVKRLSRSPGADELRELELDLDAWDEKYGRGR